MQHLCRELDRIRQRKNLTMQDICRETKFSKTTVSDCMGRPHKGRRSNPRLATLCRVSEFLGVELRVVSLDERFAELVARAPGVLEELKSRMSDEVVE